MSDPVFFEFSTSPYSSSDKLDAWRDQNVLAQVVPGNRGISNDSTIDSHFHGIHVNQLMIGNVTYTTKYQDDPVSYDAIRCDKRIREDGFDHYFFRTSKENAWRASKFDSVEHVLPHQIAIADLTKPYQVEVHAGSFVVLMVPRKLIPFDLSERHGTVVSGTLAALTSQYLHSLVTKLQDISAAEVPNVAQATLGMLTAMLMPTKDNLHQAQSELKVEMFGRIKKYIAANLASPALSVESICKEVGLSRASLYRLFAENNLGVNEYIKVARLRKIYLILSMQGEPKRRLSDIAYQYGFYSVSTLTRDFKKYFGFTPKEIQSAVWGANLKMRERSDRTARDYKGWHYV
ncbi:MULTISPECIES: AraC family transcriptional regulator [Burkholderia]|uniref:Transcriptional regulator, AraC family n=2 Tax=Burkholderia singularis TaxID=1503053 RepID=A0A238H373_9BURK|nr:MULTISPECIES: AraC family transcriptional regulator [Burkholderia]SMF99575.1 Transcriptional regulator, AraC family [Burkholderia singularis]